MVRNRFPHDCDKCRFLGANDSEHTEIYTDLYYCGRCDGGSVIARYGPELPDYMSMDIKVLMYAGYPHDHALVEAFRRQVKIWQSLIYLSRIILRIMERFRLMKQTSSLTKKLTAAQEAFYDGFDKQSLKFDPIEPRPSSNQAVVYRLYTETKAGLATLVSRYFSGATFISTSGMWENQLEAGTVIEIIGSVSDLQSIIHLAGDIRQVNHQSSVLVTWSSVSLLNVTREV